MQIVRFLRGKVQNSDLLLKRVNHLWHCFGKEREEWMKSYSLFYSGQKMGKGMVKRKILKQFTPKKSESLLKRVYHFFTKSKLLQFVLDLKTTFAPFALLKRVTGANHSHCFFFLLRNIEGRKSKRVKDCKFKEWKCERVKERKSERAKEQIPNPKFYSHFSSGSMHTSAQVLITFLKKFYPHFS